MDRFFAAKTDLKARCEELVKAIQLSPLHPPMRDDLLKAVQRVEQEAGGLAPEDSGARNAIVEMKRQVERLAVAEKWASAAQRVSDRLGSAAPATRDRLLEEQDAVIWHVRADDWDGPLTGAVGSLRAAVQEAETVASRVA